MPSGTSVQSHSLDDWLTAGAAILGILGIGLGWWWADAVAASFIAFEVLMDGVTNMRQAMADLMDQRPTSVEENKPLAIGERACEAVRKLPYVTDATIRLREEGHVFSGELFVELADGATTPQEIADRMEEISECANEIDWRIYNLVVTPVRSMAKLEADS